HELALARVGLVRQPRLAVAVTRLLAIEALLPPHGNSIPAVAVLTPVVATLTLMDVSFYDFSLATAPGAVFTPRHTTERLLATAVGEAPPRPRRSGLSARRSSGSGPGRRASRTPARAREPSRPRSRSTGRAWRSTRRT